MNINLISKIFRPKRVLKISPEIEQKFSDENLCRKCGKCCYCSLLYKNRLTIIPELPCKYLVKQTESKAICSIYPVRQKIAPWCNSVNKKTVNSGLFPDDCPYVKDIPGYQGKVLLAGEERRNFYIMLKKIFPSQLQPEYISEHHWLKFINQLHQLSSSNADEATRL